MNKTHTTHGINGMKHVFGAATPLPLRGFPAGRIKLKMRNKGFAKAYVKSEHGIQEFTIQEVDGFWQPAYRQGSNFRQGKEPQSREETITKLLGLGVPPSIIADSFGTTRTFVSRIELTSAE